MFTGRNLIVAGKHNKEIVIGPLFEKEFGVSCMISASYDTDVLGTFTGEIERKKDPLSTVREKCLMAMNSSGSDLGIASEGSFGPHPEMPFVNADDELLIFIDKKNGIEIVAREISIETNFNGRMVKTEKELLEFSKEVFFPSHALILRKSKTENQDIIKDIKDYEGLKKAFGELSKKHETVYVETDMRAMHNPSRMKVIEKAAQKLIEKIKSKCPQCQAPGFSIARARKGLPCSWCGMPTDSVLSHLSICQHCNYTKEDLFPNHKTEEDTSYCQFCNP